MCCIVIIASLQIDGSANIHESCLWYCDKSVDYWSHFRQNRIIANGVATVLDTVNGSTSSVFLYTIYTSMK